MQQAFTKVLSSNAVMATSLVFAVAACAAWPGWLANVQDSGHYTGCSPKFPPEQRRVWHHPGPATAVMLPSYQHDHI